VDCTHDRRWRLPGAEERRLPKWPLRLALSLVFLLEAFFVVMLSGERDAGNIPMIVNSVGLLLFCALTWRGIPWSRWLLIALLVWRVVQIGIDMATHFGPGDQRVTGTLILIILYVATGALVASPLGRPRMRAAT
jgi:hypothetical protein